MVQQVIERKRPVKTTTMLILLAVWTAFCFGADNKKKSSEPQVPAEIREGCKGSSNATYIRFHNQSIAKIDYDTCINTYRNLKVPGESQVPPAMRDLCKNLAIGLEYGHSHDPGMTQVKYTTCISSYLFKDVPAAPAQSSDDKSRIRRCYAQCDQAEIACDKVVRFYPDQNPNGYAECAADRRACDARCRTQ